MKKNIFRIITVLIVLSAIPFFISCRKKNYTQISDNQPAVKDNKITIGFSIDTLAIERWRRDLDVFLATAKSLNASVIVQNAGNDVQEQIRQIQYLIDKNVDVLIILPKKADSLTEVIKSAKAKNIPVISYDRLILNSDIDLFLTIDSVKVGEGMASEILKKIPYGNLYCLYGPTDDFNMAMIKEGVEKTLRGSQLRVGNIFYTADWNYDLAYNEMKRMISENQIPNAIICGNDAIANSVIQSIAESGMDSKIVIGGQDADIVNCQHIVKGRQTVTMYKPITELSKQTVYSAVRLAKGIPVSEMKQVNSALNNGFGDIPAIMLEPTAVTKDNIDEVIINSGFHTKEEVYRN